MKKDVVIGFGAGCFVTGFAVAVLVLVGSGVSSVIEHPCLTIWNDVREMIINYRGDISDLDKIEEGQDFRDMGCQHTIPEWLPEDHEDAEMFRELGLL